MAEQLLSPEVFSSLAELEGDVSGAIGSMISGDLPQGVKDVIAREAAEQGLSGGRFGELQQVAAARDVGKSSLEVASKGLEAGLQALGLADEATIAQAELDLANRQFNLTQRRTEAEMERWEQEIGLSKRKLAGREEASEWERDWEERQWAELRSLYESDVGERTDSSTSPSSTDRSSLGGSKLDLTPKIERVNPVTGGTLYGGL